MEIQYLAAEDIKAQMDAGNVEIINGVLTNSILPLEMKPVEDTTVQQVDVAPVSTEQQNIISTPVQTVDEIEQARLYADMLAKREKEKEDEYLRKLKEREDALNKEKQAKEEIVQRLQQLESMMNNKSTIVQTDQMTDVEDDEYVSEYAKRTRQMLEELRIRNADNPDLKLLMDEVTRLKTEVDSEKEAKRLAKEKEENERQQNKLFDSIRAFQLSNPELQTKRSIKELNEDYLRFRKDISYISNAKNVQELEKAIEEYYKGGDIKNIADRNGIKPVDEYGKLAKLMEVIDLKDGLKFNTRTGEYEPILDDSGNRIRYRSLEEAYKINNYYDEINKARKQAFKDVNNKLTTLQNAPVTLPQTVTSSLDEHYTTEQMREILNMPVNQWKNDPRKRQMVEKVYSDLGIPLPKVK